MIRDVALVEDRDGDLTVHRVGCPEVRRAAAAGLPVLTMLGIQRPIPQDWHRHHTCMDADE